MIRLLKKIKFGFFSMIIELNECMNFSMFNFRKFIGGFCNLK